VPTKCALQVLIAFSTRVSAVVKCKVPQKNKRLLYFLQCTPCQCVLNRRDFGVVGGCVRKRELEKGRGGGK
jgi:hypothetical protein